MASLNGTREVAPARVADGRSVMAMTEPAGARTPWSETVYVERDGRHVALRISNVADHASNARAYWFALPPRDLAEAVGLVDHIKRLAP